MMAWLTTAATWVIPLWLAVLLIFAFRKKVALYESFVQGGSEGLMMVLRMVPHVVGMMVAIAVFRASGALDALVALCAPAFERVGIPAPVWPMGLLRSLTGAGSLAYASDVMHQYGPDALWSRMVATIQGSSDTTLYVLAVYFGAVGIHKTRYALPMGLIADAVGVVASVVVCRLLAVT